MEKLKLNCAEVCSPEFVPYLLVVHDFRALRRRQAIIIGQDAHIGVSAYSMFTDPTLWHNPVLVPGRRLVIRELREVTRIGIESEAQRHGVQEYWIQSIWELGECRTRKPMQ